MKKKSNPLLKNKGLSLGQSGNTESTKFGDVMRNFGDFFYNLIDLRAGLDREGTIVNIKNNKKMAGANAWLLMCSIMIASLGLDLNSPAVIIGAMLISPLMSPILGIGLAVGINDNDALLLALKHFGIAIVIALVTSTLYFWLTPFGMETSEIRARTAPTLLDVLVAFFGGVAGIISGSRKDKSNAIPGVAIATALMPPLCVTGYGLATGNWTFMLNSFYLFFLNATFVALFHTELQSRGANHFDLNFLQDDKSKAEIELLKSGRTEYAKAVIDNKKAVISHKQRIKQMQNKIDSLTDETAMFLQIKKEVGVLFPALATYSISKDITNINTQDTVIDNTPVLLIKWRENSKLTTRKKETEAEKIMAYIKLRLGLLELKLMETK